MNSKLSGPFKLPFNGKKPSKLVIFLHGVGADGHDLNYRMSFQVA
jgi:predicted esterase